MNNNRSDILFCVFGGVFVFKALVCLISTPTMEIRSKRSKMPPLYLEGWLKVQDIFLSPV